MLNIDYLIQDPPQATVDPSQLSVITYLDGKKIFMRVMKPGLESADERRPAALILHGFPGNEKMRDVAQALRRAGFVAVLGGYFGCWGCEGEYSLSVLPGCIRANLAYLREHAGELNIDPDRIYLIGHSMGGFTTMRLLSEGEDIKGAILVAPCDMAEMYRSKRDDFNELLCDAEPFLILGKKGTDVFIEECEAHQSEWIFTELAKKFNPSKPMLFVGGKRDSLCPPASHIAPALDYLSKNGYNAECVLFDSDHSFQNKRIEFIRTLAEWLIKQEE